MLIPKILENLAFIGKSCPTEALRAAVVQSQQTVPHLLKAIEDPREVCRRLRADEDYVLPLFAFYLLAELREKKAYPLIVDFFSIPGEVTLDTTGDFVTEDLANVLTSVACGDDSLIRRLIEDRQANEYVRAVAVRSLTGMVALGEQSRDTIMAYFKALFNGRLEQERCYVWDALVTESLNLHPKDVLDEIKAVIAKRFIDDFSVTWQDVVKASARSLDECLDLIRRTRDPLIKDTASFVASGPIFHPKIPEQPTKKNKIRRNDSCPCGSGKKYKKCCMP